MLMRLRLVAFGWLAVAVAALPAQQPSASTPSSAAPADPQQRVVISVDEEKLTAADIEQILAALPPQSREYYSGPGRHLLPQYVVRMKVLSEEARRQKLDQQPEVLQSVQFATESILADAARRQMEQKIETPDELLRQVYEERKGEFEEVHLRRILIRTEGSVLSQSSVAARPPLSSSEARQKLSELRQQFLAGADFAELARAHSDDGASASAGGDLGFVTYRNLIPPIIQAANRLAPGEVSEIIPTAFGMELIQVVEKRARPLADVRPQLEAMLRQRKLEEKLQELQGQYDITVDSEFFAPRAAAPPSVETVAPSSR
jgi:parvulin-like peptidyl-prolyl isomerase